MASIGMALLGGLGAAGALGGAAMQSSAATTAAGEQAQEAQNALNFEQGIYTNEQAYQQPYIGAGQTSLAQYMKGLSSGAYGASTGPAPTFTAPTLAQAQATPGYQFTAQQGSKGILEGAAAAGGNISGGTMKSLDQYNTNLANTTYNTLFNQALSGYGANLSTWQANQAAQQQSASQVLAPVGLGETAAGSLSMAGNQTGNTVSSLMQSLGNAQAAGTIGSANAISSGISGATNSITQSMLLNSLLGGGSGGGPGFSTTTFGSNPWTPSPLNYIPVGGDNPTP